LWIVDRIVIDPKICGGQPVVWGTRVPVRTVLGFLAAGDPVEDVLEAYPTLVREDVLACLSFSLDLVDERYPLQDVDALFGGQIRVGPEAG
jgi:uncharacterized protein (DUF433 family)